MSTQLPINKRNKTHFLGKRRTAVDASGLVLGRLASNIAKLTLTGEEIVVVNAEKAVLTGSKKYLCEKFKSRLGTRTLGSQKNAPKHQRRPETLIRRVVRGMLPWKKPKGQSAYKRLKVYTGIPEELRNASFLVFPKAKKESGTFLTVGELLETFGWKNTLKVK